MLYLNLVPRDSFEESHKILLLQLTKSEDKRVVANAIEVLTHYEAHIEKKALKALNKTDLRVAANSLVNAGREELTPHVVKTLSKMLKQDSPSVVASALFAVGELSKNHRERNLVYYTAQVEFLSLVETLDQFVQHPNSMIRRQAMIAARKSAHAEVLNRVLERVTQADSELIFEEAGRYLGEIWSGRSLTSRAS